MDVNFSVSAEGSLLRKIADDNNNTAIEPEAPKPVASALDVSKIRSTPELTQSKARQFNPQATQDGRIDGREEGGIYVSQQNPMKNLNNSIEGGILRPSSDPVEKGEYEMSGFQVQYRDNGLLTQKSVNDSFIDMESAMACVNGSKYLIPDSRLGVRVSTISSGAPEISHNGSALYRYIDNNWKRI